MTVKNVVLDKLLDEAIGLYIEFKDVHGYQPERARQAAVLEILEGLAAMDEIEQLESEQRSKDAVTEYERLIDMGHSSTDAASIVDSVFINENP